MSASCPRPQATWFQSLQIFLITRKKKVSESSSGANRPVVLELYIVRIVATNVAIHRYPRMARCSVTAIVCFDSVIRDTAMTLDA